MSTVLTVAATNEHDKAKLKGDTSSESWWGSNHGPEVDIAAPGVDNITTDNVGSSGYRSGDYAPFNGTSSATPIVAGAAGLILSCNPDLTEQEVRGLLTNTADKVGDKLYITGRNDHFGKGRLNVHGAVMAAKALLSEEEKIEQESYTKVVEQMQALPIQDLRTAKMTVPVADQGKIRELSVTPNISHTYRGDLKLTLFGPASPSADHDESPVVLHDRQDGAQDDLKVTYHSSATDSPLKRFLGRSAAHPWRLEVEDEARQDTGMLNSVKMTFTF